MKACELLEAARSADSEITDLEARVAQLRQTLERVTEHAGKLGGGQQAVQDYIARLDEMEQTLARRRRNAGAEKLASVVMIDETFATDDRARAVCTAFYLDGLTMAAISMQLHISTGWAKSVKGNAVKVLRGLSEEDVARWLPDWYPEK